MEQQQLPNCSCDAPCHTKIEEANYVLDGRVCCDSLCYQMALERQMKAQHAHWTRAEYHPDSFLPSLADVDST